MSDPRLHDNLWEGSDSGEAELAAGLEAGPRYDAESWIVESIARVAHEANLAFCGLLEDFSQLPWDDAADWQRRSAIEGVLGILQGRITRPEQSHESWMAQKLAEGWQHGPVKDPDRKTHPCIAPYEELPREQRQKDAIFFAVVTTLLPMFAPFDPENPVA